MVNHDEEEGNQQRKHPRINEEIFPTHLMIPIKADVTGNAMTIDTTNFFIMSLKKNPTVCLLKPCFSSRTNVEYKLQGREVTVENKVVSMTNMMECLIS